MILHNAGANHSYGGALCRFDTSNEFVPVVFMSPPPVLAAFAGLALPAGHQSHLVIDTYTHIYVLLVASLAGVCVFRPTLCDGLCVNELGV